MHHALPAGFEPAAASWVPFVIGVGSFVVVLLILAIIGGVQYLRAKGIARKP